MATPLYLCPWATVFQYFTDAGIVLSGGLVNTYLAGTSTPQATYTDITGIVPNANPIVLMSNGRLPASIWQPGGVALKIIVTDSNGNQLGPTFDQLQGINDLVLADSALSNPTSGSGADLVANAMRSYDIFASARAANVPSLQSGQTLIVDFEGGITIADGLGGLFYWNASSTASDDNLNVLKPTALAGAGRYLRLNQNLNFYAVKGAPTIRASTTTVVIDPDLQVTLPNGGTYIIDGWLNDSQGASAGGLKGQINFSGTLVNGVWGMNGVGTAVTPVPLTAINVTAEFQSAQTGVGSMPMRGGFQCSTGGVLSLFWAQNGSNGNGSLLGPGSYLHVTRASSSTGNAGPTTRTYTSGSGTETIPVGVSTMTLEVWGASGAGGPGSGSGCVFSGGGGGGSGGYALTIINVAAANGQTMAYSVGVAGTPGGGVAGASTVSSGSYSLSTVTGGGAAPGQNGGAGGAGGAGGSPSGGNTTNTTGHTGATGGSGVAGGAGATGIAGINGTGGAGGPGGTLGGQSGGAGNQGLIIFKYV
jgi:hypothetical protein